MREMDYKPGEYAPFARLRSPLDDGSVVGRGRYELRSLPAGGSAMPNPGLVPRVEILEGKVEELAGLPDRMVALELQIVQFRAEFHAEFSAIRHEFRQEMATFATKADLEQLRGEMREEIGRAHV